MKLHAELNLPQAWMQTLQIGSTEEDTWVDVPIRVALTRDVAEAFGCRDLIYAGDCPRSGVDKIKLEGKEVDCEIYFRHEDLAFSVVAKTVDNFNVKMEGTGPKLHFTVSLVGYAVTMAELKETVKSDPIELTLKPAQIPLPLQAAADDSADESENPAPEAEAAVLVDGQSDFLEDLQQSDVVQ